MANDLEVGQMGVLAPMNLAPRASRCRNIGSSGATVDQTNARQLEYELVRQPGLLRNVHAHQVTHEPAAQYGQELRRLPYYVGITFPKPYLSFGLDASEEDVALRNCQDLSWPHTL